MRSVSVNSSAGSSVGEEQAERWSGSLRLRMTNGTGSVYDTSPRIEGKPYALAGFEAEHERPGSA
jgi:hypothetical protein